MFSIYFTLQLILNHIAFHITLYPFLLKSLSPDPCGLPAHPACAQSSSVRAVGSPQTPEFLQVRVKPERGKEKQMVHAPCPSRGQGGSGVCHR